MTTALVTGATGGLGRSLVAALRRRDMTVHAVGRRTAELDRLRQETGCIAHNLELADLEAVKRLCEGLAVDILINGAGMGAPPGPLHQTEPSAIDAVIDANLRAPMHIMRHVIPGMLERNRGHIVNIGSVAALYPLPGISTYSAAKSGIHALSALLRMDLHGSALRVTEICPGRIATDFFAAMLNDAEAARARFLEEYESLQPEDVCDSVLFALDAPPHVNISMIELTPQRQIYGGMAYEKGKSI